MNIIQHIYKLVDFLLDLLGIKFIWYKIHPPKKPSKRPPRTITLWLLSIMGALFTIASIRYELESAKLEYRISNIMMQAESNPRVLEYVPRLQNRLLPYKPSIINPISTIKSFFDYFDQFDDDILDDLQSLIVNNKDRLHHLNLRNITIREQNLSQVSFENSTLSDANLYRKNLSESIFRYSYITSTRFIDSYLVGADFSHAGLQGVDFSEANLRNANFNNAYAVGVDFSNSILFGVNLENIAFAEKLGKYNVFNGAIYNSRTLILKEVLDLNDKIIGREAINRCSRHPILFKECSDKILDIIIQPTKFPPGFDPEANGMIDISKIK